MILYKHREAWGLPSSTLSCIQVEAYLRLAAVPFQVHVCTTSSRSPSGQIPELEQEERVAGLQDKVPGSSDARDTCIQFIKRQGQGKGKDLDLKLSVSQKAEALAYSALIQTRLELAVHVSSWCEAPGFAEMQRVSAHLPFPLNYLIPWSQQREKKKQYGHLAAAQVYSDAEAALSALAARLESSAGPFFFGSEPSTLDALLVGVLLYLRHSPAAAAVLQKKVCEEPALSGYVDYIAGEYFCEPAPVLHPGDQASRSSWQASGPQSSQQSFKDEKAKPKVEASAAEKRSYRNNYLWLLGAGAASLAYVLLGGQYLQIDLRRGSIFSSAGHGGDGEDDDDDEDDS